MISAGVIARVMGASLFSIAVGAGAAGAAAGAPLSVEQAAATFGARPSVQHASLSPDGALLATIEPIGARGTQVRILDLTREDSRPVGILQASGSPERLSWCRWSGTRRLLCSIYGVFPLNDGQLSYASRLIAIDADGKRMQSLRLPGTKGNALGYRLFGGSVLDWNPGQDGHVLLLREFVPESTTGTRLAQVADGLGVDQVDTISMRTVSAIERPRPANTEFISDGQGHIRIRGIDPNRTSEGYASGITRYQHSGADGSNWRLLGDFDSRTGEGFNPYYVDPALNLAYGLRKLDGRYAAYSVSLDGQASEKLLLARPDVDVEGFVTIGRNSRVIGISYTTDKTEVEYIDPELKRLSKALSRGLPNLPLIHFQDSSQDERKLLLWAGSDVDPGRYYLLDREARGLTELAFSRAGTQNLSLATVRHITFDAADGTKIPAYLTLPPGSDGKGLPAIVMPHGGPSARDSWGFDWMVQFWANQGYAVLQPNFRGSSGYGDTWFQTNGFKSWNVAIGDVVDAGRWLIREGIADPRKLVVSGWSYGGYAALQSAAVEPDLFRAVIAIAPVTDLERLKGEWSGWSNYYLQKDFIGSGPHIEQGSPARQAGRIKAPVLMFHGTFDRNVNVGQSRLMSDRLRQAGKDGTLVVYEQLDHYLDDSEARKDMLVQSANFLQKALNAAP
ncbi:alpha/beta hydrolase family protein [Sphingobium sp. B8D3A]|uniref:alpha/beta hydrolase family protein n=2 Tax=unclassified Sphingobium TaxID=2611147 RepID=UPI002224B450|nr:S9 family peptidase [Sphingobium sp. B8D3A]MCW2411767.1 dipeptidyl aminopeptidase/acylaminoacyl peptidase [Sphingobium sp. B8D3D]